MTQRTRSMDKMTIVKMLAATDISGSALTILHCRLAATRNNVAH